MKRAVRPILGRGLALAVVVGGVFLIAVPALVRPVDGPLALLAILRAHLLIVAALGVAGAALLDRGRALATAAVVVIVLAGLTLGQEWISLPSPNADRRALSVVSWNLEVGSRSPETVVAAVVRHDADIVALQELTPDTAAALEQDPRVAARYPFRALAAERGVFGMGVLSAMPIVSGRGTRFPAMQELVVDRGGGLQINVLNVHPLPGTIRTATALGVPVAFDGSDRNGRLAGIRTAIDRLLASRRPTVVLGDFNVAPSESAYRDLSRGLIDLHAEIGNGPGWTWRPSAMEGLGLGLLRIDYVFVDPGTAALEIREDCRLPGDHCLVHAVVGLP